MRKNANLKAKRVRKLILRGIGMFFMFFLSFCFAHKTTDLYDPMGTRVDAMSWSELVKALPLIASVSAVGAILMVYIYFQEERNQQKDDNSN